VGAVCQPWLADVVFTPIPPAHFAAYSEPDQVKILWTLEAKHLDDARSRFATEKRAVATDLATDAQARAKFHGYWRRFGAGVVVIRWLFLVAICRTAERQWRAVQTGGINRKHRAPHNLRYGIHFHASSHLNPEGSDTPAADSYRRTWQLG
jgi:hypothetical protein